MSKLLCFVIVVFIICLKPRGTTIIGRGKVDAPEINKEVERNEGDAFPVNDKFSPPDSNDEPPKNDKLSPDKDNDYTENDKLSPGRDDEPPENHKLLPDRDDELPGNHKPSLDKSDTLPINNIFLLNGESVLVPNEESPNIEVHKVNHVLKVYKDGKPIYSDEHLPGKDEHLPDNDNVLVIKDGFQSDGLLPGKNDDLLPDNEEELLPANEEEPFWDENTNDLGDFNIFRNLFFFDSPSLELDKIEKSFNRLQDLLSAIFKDTLLKAKTSKIGVRNTTNDHIDIDGHKYNVRTSIFRNGTDDGSESMSAISVSLSPVNRRRKKRNFMWH